MGEPWHDYRVAPLALLLQFSSLFVRKRAVRWAIGAACFVAISAMLLYVSSIETGPDEGVNIGEPLLVLSLLASVVLVVAGCVREAVGAVVRSRR